MKKQSGNEVFTSYLFIKRDSTDVEIGFIYGNQANTSYWFGGFCYYDAAELYKGMTYSFSSYEGLSSLLPSAESFAPKMIDISLYDLQIRLQDLKPAGTYTIANLGFTSYSFEG